MLQFLVPKNALMQRGSRFLKKIFNPHESASWVNYYTGSYESIIDATFVEAKKGAQKLGKLRVARAPRSWQSSTVDLFLSPCLLRVLHHMRVSSLSQRFGPAILGTYLTDLSETKLTILILLGKNLGDDSDANSLLPTSAIEKSHVLKMADLLDATDEDGWSNDFSPGFNLFGE